MRNVLITGSSAGLGLSIAERLGRDGWRVAVNSRTAERAQATVDGLAARGIDAVAVTGDVADPAAAEAVVAGAIEALGHLDALINNAGISGEFPALEIPLDVWDQLLATNLTGAFVCAREAGKHMLERGSGTIVNMGSMWARFAMTERGPYATSKHGIHGLTKAFGAAWEERGVRSVCIDPGYIATAMVTDGANDTSHLERRTPMGRLGTAEEVAEAVSLLVERPSLSGIALTVDGGWSAYGGW